MTTKTACTGDTYTDTPNSQECKNKPQHSTVNDGHTGFVCEARYNYNPSGDDQYANSMICTKNCVGHYGNCNYGPNFEDVTRDGCWKKWTTDKEAIDTGTCEQKNDNTTWRSVGQAWETCGDDCACGRGGCG
jgi:hypothetical protein